MPRVGLIFILLQRGYFFGKWRIALKVTEFEGMHHIQYYYLIRFDQINGINRTNDEILELLNASTIDTIFHMSSISITMLINNYNSQVSSQTLFCKRISSVNQKESLLLNCMVMEMKQHNIETKKKLLLGNINLKIYIINCIIWKNNIWSNLTFIIIDIYYIL